MSDDTRSATIHGTRAPRRRARRRPLGLLGWTVRVPLGFAWLLVLAVAAVPIFVGMTALYWTMRGARALRPGRRARRAAGGADEPAA